LPEGLVNIYRFAYRNRQKTLEKPAGTRQMLHNFAGRLARSRYTIETMPAAGKTDVFCREKKPRKCLWLIR
jgi:hypothetical protein